MRLNAMHNPSWYLTRAANSVVWLGQLINIPPLFPPTKYASLLVGWVTIVRISTHLSIDEHWSRILVAINDKFMRLPSKRIINEYFVNKSPTVCLVCFICFVCIVSVCNGKCVGAMPLWKYETRSWTTNSIHTYVLIIYYYYAHVIPTQMCMESKRETKLQATEWKKTGKSRKVFRFPTASNKYKLLITLIHKRNQYESDRKSHGTFYPRAMLLYRCDGNRERERKR